MSVLIIVGLAILFFALIMASIALHEIGHLVPAKIFGVKVTEYFVGFGKRIWSTRRGETEYGFKWIPLGGYVRLVGMYPPARPGEHRNWLARMADDARAAEWDEITPADDGRLVYQQKTWKKIIIMLGGPAMNILLAFLIFLSINLFHGMAVSTTTVAAVSECVVAANRSDTTCRDDDPPTPAREAGIQPGDVIVAFNQHEVSSWEQVSQLIRDNRDGEARITVVRGSERIELPTVHTRLNHVPDQLDPTRTVEAGFLGVTPTREMRRGGPGETVDLMWTMTKQSTVALASLPVRVYNVAADMVTGKPRDVNSPLSIVGASRIAGEIGADESLSWGDKAATWFSLLGSVNLFVALLNLVPLLPLDGGHIAGAIIEWLRRQWCKLRGKPDPGPLDTAKGLPMIFIVGGLLLICGLVLIVADLVSPLQL